MQVLIQYNASPINTDRRTLGSLTRQVVRQTILTSNENSDFEVSVLYENDSGIQELNNKYRGVDKPTDVLSFSQREGQGLEFAHEQLLGDVVVSIPTAEQQARKQGHSLRREIATLLVHGTLHLIGYDHHVGETRNERQRSTIQMRKLEKKCLLQLEQKLVI